MSTHIKDQRGTLAFEIILGVLVVLAVGAAGYFAWQARHSKTDNQAVTLPSITKQADLKTYNGELDNFSFQYPADWKLDASVNKQKTEFGDYENGAESIKIESPTGLLVKVSLPNQGLGGGCDDQDHSTDASCPYIETLRADKLNSVNGNDVYLVEERSTRNLAQGGATYYQFGLEQDMNGFTPKIGAQYAFPTYFAQNTKNNSVGLMFFAAQYPEGSLKNKLAKDDFFKLPDVQAAEKVMRSLKFN